MKEKVLNVAIELAVVVPTDIDDASRTGGKLGQLLFDTVIVGIRNAMQANGATGQDASNAIVNAQIVSFAYTLVTTIAAMEGSSLVMKDLKPKVDLVLKEVMSFTGEMLGRHSQRGLFSIRDNGRPGNQG